MHAWERRLRDLSQLLRNCGETYFSPDRFRQNTNQFLQTSRTVTFIIQKNKADIPDFDAWYKKNVLTPWATDTIMSWAKDARNVVEKEGDLEMRSTLQTTLLYSYESDEDTVLETTRKELLQASIDRLLRAAKEQLPPGIADAAVLKIQRRWVANTLPDFELIYAFTYAYSQHYRVCSSLAEHLGLTLDDSVPHPTTLDPSANDVAKVRFMKFGKPGLVKHTTVRVDKDPNYKPPAGLVKLMEEMKSDAKPASLRDIVARQAKIAQFTFGHHGNHIAMLTLYDKDWKQIDFLSAAFTDQADKYIFWRNVADRAFYLNAYALVWTSESWLRDMKQFQDLPIRELPKIGEQLNIVGADASGAVDTVSWNIDRSSGTDSPVLAPLAPEDPDRKPGTLFFIKPVVAAMKMAHANSVR